MTFRIIVSTTLLGAALWPAAASAQSLAVKPGGWEMSTSMTMGGAPARKVNYKTCITKEELDSQRAFQKEADCSYTLSARSVSRWAGTMSCRGDTPRKGEFEIQARGADAVAMTMSLKAGANSMRMETTGKWASASCKGYED